MVEDIGGNYRVFVVMSKKTNRYDVPLFEFMWRLCISFHSLNAINAPLQVPTPNLQRHGAEHRKIPV